MKYNSTLGYALKGIGLGTLGVTYLGVGAATTMFPELKDLGNFTDILSDILLTSTAVSVASYFIGNCIHKAESESQNKKSLDYLVHHFAGIKMKKELRKDRFADIKNLPKPSLQLEKEF